MKRKNFCKRMAALLLCLVMVFSLTACSMTLNGTYTATNDLVGQSFTFKEDNKVDVSAFGIDIEGDYVIEDDMITITYNILGMSYDWQKSFKKSGKSIIVDGIEFVKAE